MAVLLEDKPDVPLPRPRPTRRDVPAPGYLPDEPIVPADPTDIAPDSPVWRSPEPEEPEPHALAPLEGGKHLSDLLREALAESGQPGKLSLTDMNALALALQNDPSGDVPFGSQNDIPSPQLMLPNQGSASDAWRAWMRMSQNPRGLPQEPPIEPYYIDGFEPDV